MAHPKRKHSHSRTRKKRTHQKVKVTGLAPCSNCKKLRPLYSICPFCGYYRGKKVLTIKIKEKKKEK